MDDVAAAINWPTLLGSIGVLSTVLGIAWVALRKGNAETKKFTQNGVVAGWEKLAGELQDQLGAALAEIKALRTELTQVYTALTTARSDVDIHKVEVEEQHKEIRVLEKEIVEISKTNPAELAEAIVEKMAESPVIVTNPQPDEPC